MEYDKWLAETSKLEYKLRDKDNKVTDISKQHILHIYLGIKNENVRNAYNYFFGKEQEVLVDWNGYAVSQQVADLLSILEDSEIQFADKMQEVIQEYYPQLNEVHIRTTGLDLGVVDFYFPMTSERELNVIDDIKRQGQFISAENARTAFAKPKPSNAHVIALKYINDVEHRIKMSERYIEMKKLINSNEVIQIDGEGQTVKSYITKLYGDYAFSTLNNLIDSISNDTREKEYEIISEAFGKVINNWTIAKIALNPTVFSKQLISTMNYIEQMPTKDWLAGFAEGLSNPKKTWEYMMEISPYLEHRYGTGYNKELQLLISESEKGNILDGNWVKFLTSFTRVGDMSAIVFGGYPYMKYLQKQGMAIEKAEEMFVDATIRGQQSPYQSSLSRFQQWASKNPFVRTYTVLKTHLLSILENK